MYKLLISIFTISVYSCSSGEIDSVTADAGRDVAAVCRSIEDCSDKETKEKVCVKNGCVSIGEPSRMVHIVFYPRYISSVVSDISSFKYYYLYSLDTAGRVISCEQLLNNYNFSDQPDLNLVQQYEAQASISPTGSEMYTLPLPAIKDSLIFFVFYANRERVVAIGCAERIDTTSSDSVGIFPCKPEQINACLGKF